MTAGFTLKKIELSKPESASSNRAVVRKDQKTALLSSMKRNSAHHTAPRKKLIKGLGITAVILVVLLLIIVIGIMLPMRSILVQARETAALAKETMAAAESQNIAATGEKLTALKDSLAKLENSYQKTGWIGFVPIVGAYYKDGENGLKAASEFIEAGLIAVDAITPYADLLGLKEGGTSFVDQPADKRIETAVKTFDKVTPRLGEIGEHLANAKESIDVIDPSRYPVKVGNKEIRPKIRKAKDMADQTIGVFLNAQPFLESLPRFLGEPDPKRYLILFQNDKELRATGGFLTAYALFRIEHGKIIVEKSEDIYKLDERQKRRLPAPSEIEKYHKGVTYAYIRDSNLSPDFYESMRTFDELMKNVSDPEQYDGIIAVDTYVLV
ncbi:DUF4012 domain-containing protein, partial [Candidatus Roizmanbacteria bacterium]|nr:DUF4012 domain-containing protein [Candidatus Roizmanbacteria bacterium]